MEEKTPNFHQKESLKRRSAVFQRRSILLKDINNEAQELDETECWNGKSFSQNNKEDSKVDLESKESFDLREYINNLKRERQRWHEVLQERRVEQRKLAKRKAALEKTGQVVDLSVLTESETNFIKARPNYEEIVKNNQALLDMAVKVAVINQHCTAVFNNLNSKIDERIENATKKIVSMVD